MQMTIYDAATVGSRSNCVYPNPVTVTNADTMRQAAAFDHVCAAYKQNYRSVDNFLKADCLPMDCDNDHSDDPDDWLTPFDVAMDFPGVGMIFVYSRSHMKPKGKRGPRPRFHVYFICTETTDAALYSSWKDRLIADYPYFDDGAKDSARFLFGVKNAQVEVYDGSIMFSSKIKCGECGCWYGSKVWHSTDKYRRAIYQCNHKYKGGKPCSTPHVTEEQVKDTFVRAVNILLSEKDELGANVRAVIAMLCDSSEQEKRQAELKEELEVVVGLVERCVAENARTALDQDEYSERYNGLVSRYEAVKAQFDEVTQAIADKADRKKLLEQFLQTVETQEPVTEFDERLWSSLVDFVTVYSEKDIRATFKDGTEICPEKV